MNFFTEHALLPEVSGVQTRVATGLNDLEGWGDAYDRFLRRAGDYHLFYERGWLQHIWGAYSLEPCSLYFISVWQGEEIIGLAPFQLLQKGAVQGWRRVLSLLGTHHPTLVSPLPDILMAKGESRSRVMNAILKHLTEHSSKWDQINLNHIPADSASLKFIQYQWPHATLQYDENRAGQIYLAHGYPIYESSLSRNMLRHLRRCRKLLETRVEHRLYSTTSISAKRWEQIRTMHLVRQRRLEGRGRTGRYSVFANLTESAALQGAIDWAGNNDHARHYWLDIDGVPAAFALGLFHENAYFYYFIGMDERAEPYSGGMVLLLHLIEQEAALGTLTIDMMCGMNWNKCRFANRQQILSNCYINNRRMVSAARNSWVKFARKLHSLKPVQGKAGGRTL